MQPSTIIAPSNAHDSPPRCRQTPFMASGRHASASSRSVVAGMVVLSRFAFAHRSNSKCASSQVRSTCSISALAIQVIRLIAPR